MHTQTTPRMHIVWTVLEGAKDNNDEFFMFACRRLIAADRLGWQKHASRRDWKLVSEMYDAITEMDEE